MTFEEVFTYEHLFISAKKCCRGVRWKNSTQMFEIDMARWVTNLYKDLHSGNYKSKGFTEFDIVERGKKRHIQAVHISERCVQKCLCEYFLKPLLQPMLIYDNSANIKGKGTDFAINRLKQQLTTHYKRYGRSGGILLMDYHNYFGSIDHDILLRQLRIKIKDDRLYELLAMFINCFDEVGLGLGSEVSQILAVFFTNRIDHYVKEYLHVEFYAKYMDDSYAIDPSIQKLEFCEKEIRRLSGELGLVLNERTRVARFTSDFTYLKKRIKITESGAIVIRISRENITHQRQRLKRQAKKEVDASASITCWGGYALQYNAYHTVCSMRRLYYTLFAQKGLNYVNRKRLSAGDADCQ